MTVVERGTGDGIAYFVVENVNAVEAAGPFRTSSEAWRWIDRQEGQPVSKSESRSMYIRESRGGVA